MQGFLDNIRSSGAKCPRGEDGGARGRAGWYISPPIIRSPGSYTTSN